MSVQRAIKSMFNGPKKGETFELKSALVSQYPNERKEGIKRVIKAMTVGKDVSALFPDVLKNIATRDLEQKKLVYLYLMNYAKTNPELCILAVNTFVQDTEDPNPLVRALAIRTMGCIRVNKMVDYMHIPLKRTLSDDNPYVRKTAAVCVAKLFDLNKEMCIEQGFLDHLKRLIDDSNPAVVSNAINALSEINQMDPTQDALKIDGALLKKILMALNECTEWGRITILTALADYHSTSSIEASHIIERVVPQLQHANPSVVLTSIKTILSHIDKLDGAQYNVTIKKLSAPLISLISSSPEIQFISLRNIRIILEKYPDLLSKELRIFYIKYNDPLYLKLEKVEIMVRLANMQNYKILLNELKEYSMEIDYEFVKRSVIAIGQVAIKLGETATAKAIEILIELINTRSEYVLNEVFMVLKDILRKFPNNSRFLGLIIPVIVSNYQQLDDSNAIASFIWLLGEYPKNFGVDLDSILPNYYQNDNLDNYFNNDDDYTIQLQLLITIVRINIIKQSSSSQNFLQKTLTICTEKSDNPDIRDRAFIYWRLLSSNNTTVINNIVQKPLPIIDSTIPKIPQYKVDELVSELGTLSSIYHEPASEFMDNYHKFHVSRTGNNIASKNIDELQQIAKNEIVNKAVKSETLLDFDDEPEYEDVNTTSANSETNTSSTTASANVLNELNDLFNFNASPVASQRQVSSDGKSNDDIMGLFSTGTAGVANGLQNLNLNSQSSLNNSVSTQSQPQPGSQKPSDDLLNLF
ncbi:Apl2 protein [Saccharomycopsis crataegensis]|uniref:AP complex subunit beta n=1 Tax=Saccharomycopsis crataegensis TaxID=43959 RepID=A0AAV5QJB5_9ASCO|nr:Apl2 protein [Saccharomycopsis crataegensis]